MIWMVVGLIAVSVTLFVLAAARLVTDQEARVVRRRLQEAAATAGGGIRELREQRERQNRREALETFLENFGERVGGEKARRKSVREMLILAGYRRPNAGVIYMGSRFALAGLLLALAMFAGALLGASGGQQLLLMAIGGLGGWMFPFMYMRRKVRSRQEDIQRTLPDALDLMVVCVEAGLGLNQALVRVAEEMERVSPTISEEFALVGLEMRAGTPRQDALRNLGERTGLPDMRSFVAMLVQTDRFGTSVADALRVHADELRTKRRQRAEEAAAKLTVKLIFPIILFIFPSLFIVILAPAMFHILESFGGGF